MKRLMSRYDSSPVVAPCWLWHLCIMQVPSCAGGTDNNTFWAVRFAPKVHMGILNDMQTSVAEYSAC